MKNSDPDFPLIGEKNDIENKKNLEILEKEEQKVNNETKKKYKIPINEAKELMEVAIVGYFIGDTVGSQL
jgi:hypothetical protein